MEALLHQILEWVARNPGWAYGAVFAVAMGESLAIVGMMVPGVAMLIGAGALIAAKAIDFWPAFFAASAGAIAGDGLSYSLGRHYDRHIRGLWPFSRFPHQLDRGVAFFERHGTWSVAFARFVGPGRAIVPLVAGMLAMPPGRFYFANVSSALAQSLAFFLPGMIFGASLALAAEAALRLSLLAVLLVAFLWLSVWLAQRTYGLLAPHASARVQGLLAWADLHPVMGRVARALADPGHPEARTLTALAFLLTLAALLLGAAAGLTLLGAPELALNRAALDLGLSLHTPFGNRIMAGLALLGSPSVLLPLVAVLALWALLRRRARHAWYWLAAAGFPVVAAPLLAALLAVPRPDLGLAFPLPWSFPSAPVLLAACVYGFLAVALAGGVPERLRWLPYATASALAGGVAWSRVYFGAEWLTDVVASLALGLAWTAALGLAYRRHRRADPRLGALASVSALALAASLALSGWGLGLASPARFIPTPEVKVLTRADWLADGWRRLPERREDLSQQDRYPLTLQYAGDPEDLARALAPGGWQPARLLDWGNALKLLSPSLPVVELPVIPQVHAGRHEDLALARTGPNGVRQVLRLWASGFRLADGMPLWVGNLTGQRKETVVNLIAFPATDPAAEGLDARLRAELAAAAGRLPPGARLLTVPPESGAKAEPSG